LGAAFAESLGEGVAQPLVVGVELADALRGELKPALQGGVAAALAVGDGARRRGMGALAQPLDLGAQVGLAVEPGTGDSCFAGDGLDGDRQPVLSIRRTAARARRRVVWERRRAAATRCWELSARIGHLGAGGRVVGESGDDVVEVAQDLLVHLDQAGLAAGLGPGNDLQDLLAVGVVLG
jgi:hypothetical protein